MTMRAVFRAGGALATGFRRSTAQELAAVSAAVSGASVLGAASAPRARSAGFVPSELAAVLAPASMRPLSTRADARAAANAAATPKPLTLAEKSKLYDLSEDLLAFLDSAPLGYGSRLPLSVLQTGLVARTKQASLSALMEHLLTQENAMQALEAEPGKSLAAAVTAAWGDPAVAAGSVLDMQKRLGQNSEVRRQERRGEG